MRADGVGQRFLLATAIARYSNAPHWDRPGLVDARAEIVALFTGSLGYQHVGELGLNPTRDQLTRQLRAFCRSPQRRPDDMVAVYIAGHGEILEDSQEHVLLTSDTDPDDVADALPTAELARKMLLDTPVRRVLLMLDACYSGRGGNELAAAALTRMTQHWGDDPGSALVVITSAHPAEQAQTGAFPRLLRAAVEGLPTAGYTPSVLALDTVVKAMNDNPDRPGFQTISSTLAQLTGEVPAFLPNPRHNPRMTEVDLAIQQAIGWDTQAERRDLEYRTRLLATAMGGHDPARGWWFSGRHTAMIDITGWLARPDPARPLLAVTAAPGSGKTAVLGLIATLTHPDRRATVPHDGLGLPAAAVPAPGTVDVVIYAKNLTLDQVFDGITAAARRRADNVGELLDQLTERATPLTVLIDALDEAAEPEQIARRLLRPLAEHADGRLRLLVGTRPHLLAHLGVDRATSVDLDSPRYADLPALTTYAARCLLDSVPDSPYQRQPPSTIRAIAHAVAQASEPSFLVARITSGALAADLAIPDPSDPTWRATLPRLPGDAMRHDLQTRLGDDAAARAWDLLRPLAFAEGQGLPWEDIWAPLASRTAGVTYTDDDLLWLRRQAGSYVVEATEAGRSAYRLYHQALAEHLRGGVDTTSVHQTFTYVLRSRVPTTLDGTQDWARAHPYTLRHLATHAAHSGLLDELITDTGYLVHAGPDELLIALHNATTDEGRVTGSVYRASAAVHRHLTPARRRYVLATDAARFAATAQHHTFAEPLHYRPRWATGHHSSPALHATLTGHDGTVHAVACTTVNGRPVAVTGGDDGTVRVWDLATGTPHATLTGHDGSVHAVACTVVEGRPVAVTGGFDKTLRVWDLAAGLPHATLTGHDGWVRVVACITVAGRPIVVSAENTAHARVWDLTTGTLRVVLAGAAEQDWFSALACTTIDGRPVAVIGASDQKARIWDLISETPRAAFSGEDYWMHGVACTTIDGRPVAVGGGFDREVRVWDLTTGTLRATLTGHDGSAGAVACTVLDGRPVAVTGGDDTTVRVWDLATGTLRSTLTGHDGSVHAVACTVVDGRPMAVSAGGDRTVRVWDLTVEVGNPLVGAGHTADIAAVAGSIVDGHPVAVSAGNDMTVRVWDLATGRQRAILTDHDDNVKTVACTTIDGRPVAVTGGYDKTLRVWDLTTGSLHATLPRADDLVYAVACTVLDGNPVAVTGGLGKTLRVWDLRTGTLRIALTGDQAAVSVVACTVLNGNPVAVTGGHDGTVQVWDLTTGTLCTALTAYRRDVTAMACTLLDSRPVAVTGSHDPTLRVWDLSTGTLCATLTGHQAPVTAVACTAINGQAVAVTGSQDKTVRVWDLATAAEMAILDHAAKPTALCIGPGQEIIISTGWDLAVVDWPLVSRT
jgi:WD40 repeat protein